MALRANALTSLANCHVQLDIPILDTTQDALLTRLIDSASQQIDNYCNRQFVSASYTQYFDGNRANEIILPRSPITTISSVSIDSGRVFGTDSLLPATDFGFVGTNILRRHSGNWGTGSQIIKVVYTAGYTVIPADVEDACILLVECRYRLKNERILGKSSQGKAGENVSFLNDWPVEALTLLEPYRLFNYVDSNAVVQA
jgi:hypothetical protein